MSLHETEVDISGNAHANSISTKSEHKTQTLSLNVNSAK